MQNKKIKIFFFIDSFRIGGMHRQILYLIRNLDLANFEPIMITQSQNGGLKQDFISTNCKLIDLKWNGGFSFGILYRLIKALNKEQPEIIYITQPYNLIYFLLAKIFYRKKIVQVGSFRALTFWYGNKNKIYLLVDKLLSKIMYKTSEYIVANSVAIKNNYEKLINTKENKRIKVIYNGSDFNFLIDKTKQKVFEELNFHVDDKLVVMIARLDPWKDFETLIYAAKLVIKDKINIKFLIVGDGELKSKINNLIEYLNIGKYVIMLGEKIDVYNYINAADISVLSTNGEGFSNTILESMAMEKIVIATAVGGNIELLSNENNKYGILIPEKSPVLFAEAILDVLNNKEKYELIRKAAKEQSFKLCNIKRFTDEYELFFLNCVKKDKVD